MSESADLPADSWYILDVDSRDWRWDSAAIIESDVRDSMTDLIAHFEGPAIIRHPEQGDIEV